MRRALLLTALSVVTMGAPVAGQEPSLATLLERMGRYAAAFQEQLSNIVAEERYVQDVTYRFPRLGRPATTHRELRSDVLLVRTPGSNWYAEFRDVFEVDGRAIRDRQERLTKLFLDPAASSAARIAQINDESARYNIGSVERTINMPTLPLHFLLPRNQSGLRFTRRGASRPALIRSSDAPSGAAVISYDETEHPTLIRTTGGEDLPAHGRVWLDAESGRVVLTELVTDDSALHTTIDVTYRWDARVELMVPAEMYERYEVRRDSSTIVGRATYGNVRQFQVQTQTRPR